MADYTIKPGVLERAMRVAVDMAVHQALSRFGDELPRETHGLVSRIATAAAHTAVEQFRTYANSELRLIMVDHERRAEAFNLRPLDFNVHKPTSSSITPLCSRTTGAANTRSGHPFPKQEHDMKRRSYKVERNPKCDFSALSPEMQKLVTEQCKRAAGHPPYCVDANHACLRCQELAAEVLGSMT